MATVEELVRDILASMGSDAGAPLVARWVDNRYKELMAKVPPRTLREVGELYIPAVYDTGTITATRGSTTVTGSSTAWTTGIGSSTQEYWYFRGSSVWYKISSIGGDTSMTLNANFAEDSLSAGASYYAVKRYHPLDSNARWVTSVQHTRLRSGNLLMSLDEMNIRYPGRRLVGVYPFAVAQVGVDSNGYLMMEVYPPPSETELLHYVFYNLPTALTLTSTIPSTIDPHVLKEGVLIDYYRWKQAKAADANQIETAAFWRNEARSQRVEWERRIQEAMRTNQGVDDTTFTLQRFGISRRPTENWQRNAHDIVYDRWTNPA